MNDQELKNASRDLFLLMDNPEPGCFTWSEAVHYAWKRLAEGYYQTGECKTSST